ncbi:flagellar hook protein FlgE [Duganella sp. HH101]|uniref:flagellar hook protein FlgE n=1 Tax=Duganella sp. HH101 TaxID=1781066 RepID=UPI000874F610|nr:flagellar hook-basal body complex protein [Duganella sp. HH101]OFA06675.1 flagellar hook protein FlgE [Duganella sp. HH101]
MFDTLFIGTSGLLSNAKGLKIVSNNLANVNTPGFKGSQLQFADLFEQGGGVTAHEGHRQPAGQGVASLGAKLNFRPGSDQSTGNALDQSINGNGLFTLRRDGELRYTRAGDFQFDGKEVLTNGAGDHVQALDGSGKLVDITLSGLERNAAKATATVKLTGNVTTAVATPPVDSTVNGVTVIDAAGTSHTLVLTLKDAGGGSYTVSAADSTAPTVVLGTGTIKFASGTPVAGSDGFNLQYLQQAVKLDFSGVTAQGTPSGMSMKSQDGYAAGVRTDQTIDNDGTINVRYSNGQTAKGPRLALAQFVTESDLEQAGGGAFTKTRDGVVQYGYAGTGAFGTLTAGHREGSNVDLAEEFSNLIVMQRGYQAASHVISTANDMIQELFDMKGHR